MAMTPGVSPAQMTIPVHALADLDYDNIRDIPTNADLYSVSLYVEG